MTIGGEGLKQRAHLSSRIACCHVFFRPTKPEWWDRIRQISAANSVPTLSI